MARNPHGWSARRGASLSTSRPATCIWCSAPGADTDAQGYGVVDGQRLYQLIRQSGTVRGRVFTIQFLTPDVEAYSFTFG